MYEPFNYTKSVYGGTEYMARNFFSKIFRSMDRLENYQCHILPGYVPPLSETIKDPREVIMWMHNTPTQFGQQGLSTLSNKVLISKTKYVIVPSQAAKDLFLRDIPEYGPDKIYVIPNAIDKATYNPAKFENPGKIKLIHTSGKDRALPILMESLKYIDEDFRLEIYNDFDPDFFPDLVVDDRVVFYGRTPRATVKEAFENSHIFVYPSVFEETFCLSMAEAMSAGALPIYSKIGSLEEIGNGHGIPYNFIPEHDKHAEAFAKHLYDAILKVKNREWDPTKQIEYVNSSFSWDAVKEQWLAFNEVL